MKRPALVLVALAFSSCAAPSQDPTEYSLQASCAAEKRAARYDLQPHERADGVTLRVIDGRRAYAVGRHELEVAIAGADGRAVEGARLDVTSDMPDHGHGAPYEPSARELGSGRYRIEGVELTMAGFWEVPIRVETQGAVATMTLRLCAQ